MAKNKKKKTNKAVYIDPFSPKGLLIGFLNSVGASMVIYAIMVMMRQIPLVIDNKIQFHYNMYLPLLIGYFIFLFLLRSKFGDNPKMQFASLFGFALFATFGETVLGNIGMTEMSIVMYISILITALIAPTLFK